MPLSHHLLVAGLAEMEKNQGPSSIFLYQILTLILVGCQSLFSLKKKKKIFFFLLLSMYAWYVYPRICVGGHLCGLGSLCIYDMCIPGFV